MSEVDVTTPAGGSRSGRVRVDSTSGPLRVVAGEVDVFAVSTDGSFVPMATCDEGCFVLPPSAPAALEVLTRLDGAVEFVTDVPDDAVTGFVARLTERLAEKAQPLGNSTRATIADDLAEAIATVVSSSNAGLTEAATQSRRGSDSLYAAAIDRAVFSAETLRSPVEGFDVSPLVAVFQVLGKRQKFQVSVPTEEELKNTTDPIRLIAHKSSLRYRWIDLSDGWQDKAVTRFLGFLGEGEDRQPVALVRRGRYYTIQGSGDVRPRRLTDGDLARLDSSALEIYTPFDPDREARLRDVLRISLVSTKSSWTLTLLMALGVVLLGLLTPVVTNTVIGTLIPQERKGLLASAGAGLVLAAIGIFIFSMVQNFSISRISQVSTRNLQSAFWDRLMSLPVTFYRRFNSGELAIRALAVDNLSSVLSVQVVSATLTPIAMRSP